MSKFGSGLCSCLRVRATRDIFIIDFVTKKTKQNPEKIKIKKQFRI